MQLSSAGHTGVTANAERIGKGIFDMVAHQVGTRDPLEHWGPASYLVKTSIVDGGAADAKAARQSGTRILDTMDQENREKLGREVLRSIVAYYRPSPDLAFWYSSLLPGADLLTIAQLGYLGEHHMLDDDAKAGIEERNREIEQGQSGPVRIF